uniref:Venom peptide Thd9.3 n=1 Tax=Turris hidalgoi TaxID=1566138 RepID=A0A976QMU7_9CAEN|nr:venom peptide precursor Thd9.3 [Turris hidalgoi]
MKFQLLTLALFLTVVMSIGATPIKLVKNERWNSDVIWSALDSLMMKTDSRNQCGCTSFDVGDPCPGSGLCKENTCTMQRTCVSLRQNDEPKLRTRAM